MQVASILTTVKETVSLNAPAADIWSFINDFDCLDDWHPAVAASEAASTGVYKGGFPALIEKIAAA